MAAAANPWGKDSAGLGGADGPNLTTPPFHWAAVTPSDTVDLPVVARALWIGVSGDISVISANGETAIFKSVPVGYWLGFVARVTAANTTATNIIAVW